ncbi:MAG TPA: SRPBCC domain-containing protein [Solirubrobacterales bacterium]|nr:SRPBCC domain-containing protein [Solirubrobacterales bacterium]
MAEAPAGNGSNEIVIGWTFDAPRDRVWREWTEAERFADWYGGPADVPLETVVMDVRPGGRWSLVMHAERGTIYWDGEYLEVDEPERLVFTVTDEPDKDQYAVCTVVLTDTGDGRTDMLFSQIGPLPPEQLEPAKKGWSGFFERIGQRLAAD